MKYEDSTAGTLTKKQSAQTDDGLISEQSRNARAVNLKIQNVHVSHNQTINLNQIEADCKTEANSPVKIRPDESIDEVDLDQIGRNNIQQEGSRRKLEEDGSIYEEKNEINYKNFESSGVKMLQDERKMTAMRVQEEDNDYTTQFDANIGQQKLELPQKFQDNKFNQMQNAGSVRLLGSFKKSFMNCSQRQQQGSNQVTPIGTHRSLPRGPQEFDEVQSVGDRSMRSVHMDGRVSNIPFNLANVLTLSQQIRAPQESQLPEAQQSQVVSQLSASVIASQVNVSPSEQIQKAKREYTQNLILQSIIYGFLLWQVIDKLETILSLWVNNEKELVIFVLTDMAIYTITIIFYTVARFTINQKNLWHYQVIDWVLILATLINSFIGAHAFCSESMSGLIQREPTVYQPISNLVNAMLWIRFSFVVLVLLVVLVLSCYLMYLAAQRGNDRVSMEAERIKRMPMVRLHLQQKAKKYDPKNRDNADDVAIDQCAICLDNFSEQDSRLVAQLNCNGKHIFHVDCLQEWIKTNDICPMCREPILAVSN